MNNQPQSYHVSGIGRVAHSAPDFRMSEEEDMAAEFDHTRREQEEKRNRSKQASTSTPEPKTAPDNMFGLFPIPNFTNQDTLRMVTELRNVIIAGLTLKDSKWSDANTNNAVTDDRGRLHKFGDNNGMEQYYDWNGLIDAAKSFNDIISTSKLDLNIQDEDDQTTKQLNQLKERVIYNHVPVSL